jgi:hypothetical protein
MSNIKVTQQIMKAKVNFMVVELFCPTFCDIYLKYLPKIKRSNHR